MPKSGNFSPAFLGSLTPATTIINLWFISAREAIKKNLNGSRQSTLQDSFRNYSL